jgi:phytoene dehydrogenase-like protein
MSEYDVVIVGAGHNGLTAGVELSRAGKKVLILEQSEGPGGMAATREIFPGYKHSVGAWALLIFREEMLSYLELDKEGFEVFRPESSYTVFGDEDTVPFIGYCDPIELANHLVEDHGFEAMQGFHEIAAYFAVWKEVFDKYLGQPTPPVEEIIAGIEDKKAREAFAMLTYGSTMEVLRKFFPSSDIAPAIQGSLCASAVDGTHLGPFSKGSAASLSYHYCCGDNYDFKIPKGGIGELSYALERVFKRYAEPLGGAVRYKDAVDSFIMDGGIVTGVKMKSGEEITASTVISTLDAQATFLRLADTKQLPADYVAAVEEIEYTNGYIQIHLTLSDLPTFSGHMEFVNGTPQSYLMAYIKSPEQLHEAWKAYQDNRVSDDPAVYFYFPTQLDPQLAPEGKHTCTLFAHYFPANPPHGEFKAMKNEATENMLNVVEKVAPGFRDLIIDKATFTQHYFERNFGATQGDFAQGLLHPDQMFGDRPVANWSREEKSSYETPLANLFMAGGGCAPGPGVTCLPGMYGAKIVLHYLDSGVSDAGGEAEEIAKIA